MLEGIYTETILMFPESRVHPIEPQETGGVIEGSQSIYRYSLKDSDYPILTIVDKILDSAGNTIPSGHYELALSDEKDFLIIMQGKTPIAIVPTFKVEEDESAYKKPDKKTEKIKKQQEEEREKTNKKRARVGIRPDEEKVHMEASIEYIKEGDYYLIKYERGAIRAWGAIKG